VRDREIIGIAVAATLGRKAPAHTVEPDKDADPDGARRYASDPSPWKRAGR
jgi:hypothetical protein